MNYKHQAKITQVEELQGDFEQKKTTSYQSASRGKRVTKDVYSGWNQKFGEEIEEMLRQLADLIANLPELAKDGDGKAVRPPSEIKYTSTHTTSKVGSMTKTSIDGLLVEANILSTYSPSGKKGSVGTAASYYSELYKSLRGQNRNIIAAHLLNHHLHGSGSEKANIVPLSDDDNKKMETYYESKAKKAIINDNQVLKYIISVSWGEGGGVLPDHAIEEAYLPAGIHFTIIRKKFTGEGDADKKDPKKWTDDSEILNKNMPTGGFASPLGASKLEESLPKLKSYFEKLSNNKKPLPLSRFAHQHDTYLEGILAKKQSELSPDEQNQLNDIYDLYDALHENHTGQVSLFIVLILTISSK